MAIVVAMVGAYVRRSHDRVIRPTATVVFPSLSDGDCAVIRTPDQRIIVVDAGGPASGSRVAKVVQSLHGDQIDLLILASDQDTGLGGVPALLASSLPIRSIWNSAAAPDDPYMVKIAKRVSSRKIPYRIVHSGEAYISRSGVRVSVVWPSQRSPHIDTAALAIRVDYGFNSILLLGPLAASSEPNIISEGGQKLPSTVLQIPDHGSDDGTSLELLRRVAPEVAVISCNADSPPSPGVLHRLQAAGAAIWRTDRQGAITVTMDGHGSPALSASRL